MKRLWGDPCGSNEEAGEDRGGLGMVANRNWILSHMVLTSVNSATRSPQRARACAHTRTHAQAHAHTPGLARRGHFWLSSTHDIAHTRTTGDASFSNPFSYAFGAVFALASVILVGFAMGKMAGAFAEAAFEKKRRALFRKELDLNMILSMDADGSGKIEIDEFLLLMANKMREKDKEEEKEIDLDASILEASKNDELPKVTRIYVRLRSLLILYQLGHYLLHPLL